MPTYNYECDACGHAFELFQSMTARVKRKCPECGRPKLQRLIGPGAGIIFRGSGFYETDYRSASYRAGAKSADGGDGGKDAGKDASSKPTPAGDTSPAGRSGTGGSGSTSKSGD